MVAMAPSIHVLTFKIIPFVLIEVLTPQISINSWKTFTVSKLAA